MAKYTPNAPSSGFLTATEISNELNAIKQAIDDQLDRKGASPNNMDVDLDMNSRRILNLPDALTESEPVTLRQFNSQSTGTKTTGTLKSKVVATAGQTVFVTPGYVVGSNNLHVYVNGVRQANGAYTEDNSNQITFTSPLLAGDVVEFVVNELPESEGVISSTNVTHNGISLYLILSSYGAVSIKTFGAKGDGVSDDTNAFIAAEGSSVGDIFLDTGTYKYNPSLVTLSKKYFGPGLLDNGGGAGNPKTSTVPFSANNLWDWESTIDNAVVLQRGVDGKATRLYLMPKGSATGTRSSLKIFFDDFREDPANYRDFNITATDSLNGGTYSADGAVLLNLKTLGSYRDKDNPDIVFCYNDAVSTNFIAGRIVHEYNGGNARHLWNFGTSVPSNLLPASAVTHAERDMAIVNGYGIRWAGSDGTYDWRVYLDTDDSIKLVANGVEKAVIDANGGWNAPNGESNFLRQRVVSQSVTYSPSYTPDMFTGSSQKLFLTGDITVNAPINAKDGDWLELIFAADTSSRTITFDSSFKIGSYTTTVSANTTNVYTFRNTGGGVWRLVAAPAIGI